MIRAILIDFDGVLRNWSPTAHAQAEERSGLPKGAILKAAFAPDLLLPAITGQLSDEAWRQQIVMRLEQTYPDADAVQAVHLWSESAGSINEPVMTLMRTCRQQVPLVLVTNATSRLPNDLKRLHIADEFDAIINSSEIGVAKPDQAFYEIALQFVCVPAHDVIFIDDSAKNVATGLKLGMIAHLFEGLEPLRQMLSTYKLL